MKMTLQNKSDSVESMHVCVSSQDMNKLTYNI